MSDDLPTSETDKDFHTSPALPGLGVDSTSDDNEYQVLARKYRPQNFIDLIGQDPMVRTLKNAFAVGRIAHAYMLTGVRGVGKTTTARLIARALNFETDQINQPSIELSEMGRHCEAIARSSHVDVMEMDAASRTGVGDIREILDGVRYAPVSARYKVYIIDEVHMLSTSAFNALLKTLEEPPEHVKFIFATTEIRKVPVTVLSRCQRFDLKRVDRERLCDHLKWVCEREGSKIEHEGLSALARAAEGSVRDGLSLLDQAIVQGGEEGAISLEHIREMLGLADRSRVLDLLEATLKSDASTAFAELKHQYDSGADPQVLIRDVLDYLHALNRLKAAGPDIDLGESQETTQRLASLSDAFSLASLSRLWKTTLNGLEDVRTAPDPVSAAEMVIIRLMAAANLPSPDEAARLLAGMTLTQTNVKSDSETKSDTPADAKSFKTDQTESAQKDNREISAQSLETFEDFFALVETSRDINLSLDIERYVRPVSIHPGRLAFESAHNAPANLGGRIAKFLNDQTRTRWMVDASAQNGLETIKERRLREKANDEAQIIRDPAMVKAMMAFPGSELINVGDHPTTHAGEGDLENMPQENQS